MVFVKRVDGARGEIPPYRIADKYVVEVAGVYFHRFNGRAGVGIGHFHRTARLLVVPVEVGGRVSCLRDDFAECASVALASICAAEAVVPVAEKYTTSTFFFSIILLSDLCAQAETDIAVSAAINAARIFSFIY